MKRGKIICDNSHNGKRNLGVTAIAHQSVSRMNSGSEKVCKSGAGKHAHLWSPITFILMSEQKETHPPFSSLAS